MHGHHHHHRSLPMAPKPKSVKHHYGSGKNTVKVVLLLVACLITNLAWSCAGVNHP